MSFKEAAKWAILAFLITMSGIVVYTYLHMLIFDVEFSLGKKYFGELIRLSLICGVSMFWYYNKRDISNIQMRIKMIIHFVVLYALVMVLCLRWRWILPRASHIVFLSIVIICSFVTVYLTMFIEDKITAKKLNEIFALKKKK